MYPTALSPRFTLSLLCDIVFSPKLLASSLLRELLLLSFGHYSPIRLIGAPVLLATEHIWTVNTQFLKHSGCKARKEQLDVYWALFVVNTMQNTISHTQKQAGVYGSGCL